MIVINLLSPSQKKELKIKRLYIAIKELVMLILLFTSIIAILLLSSKYILDNRLAKLIEKNAYAIQQNMEVVRKIKSINEKIKIVDKIQLNFKQWSEFLFSLNDSTPENISYEIIRINYEDATIELKGIAKTRNDLTKLEDNLKNSNVLENVNLPLQSLLPKENNKFSIIANINIGNIK